jgi:hypothetical protein
LYFQKSRTQIILEADQTEVKKYEDSVIEQTSSDWNLPTTKVSDNWTNDSSTLVSDSSISSEKLADLPKKVKIFQTTRLIYLSKRSVWISTIFALLSFIFPYIYTKRWKPFCILFTLVISGALIFEEEALLIAPWISAIDNGVAISKSKNKVKHKLS